jgi:hypothetical protein
MVGTDILTLEGFTKRLAQMDSEEIEDTIIAVKAAHAMANRHKEDMAILFDYRIVPLKDNDEPPLEIVRYKFPA